MIQTPTRGLRLPRRDRAAWLAERPLRTVRALPLVALRGSDPVGIYLDEQGLWEAAPAGAVVGRADTALWVLTHPGVPETPVVCFLAPAAATRYDLTTAARHALAGRPSPEPQLPTTALFWIPVAVITVAVLAVTAFVTLTGDVPNVNPL